MSSESELLKPGCRESLLSEEVEDDGELGEEEWDDWEGTKSRPARWAPLGANDSDKEQTSPCDFLKESVEDVHELKKIKDDHEQLTSALMALTTHFAQVQFRIQQIVAAPTQEKEQLLHELEDFTFRGIPSAVTDRIGSGDGTCHVEDMKEIMRVQREQQKDLINQLKTQLEELELYAYETGEAGLPQSVLLERHKLVVEQFKERLNLNVDEKIEKLSNDDLKLGVDQAISDFVSPMKLQTQLVDQLKTQISDLERFIQYSHPDDSCSCACPKHNSPLTNETTNDNCRYEGDNNDELRTKLQLMRKLLMMIQMFAVAQFGCSSNQFQMNSLKKHPKGSHWGDLRAALEVAISKVYNLAVQSETPADSDYTSDCEDAPSVICNQALTSAVRKDLAIALANLLEHGLVPLGHSQSLLPFMGCFPSRSSAGSGFLTAWDLILKYYQIKNGEKYNATPARKLSQSFGLEIVGSTAITNKQLLLSTIDNIVSSHTRYKRSSESHLKAFVCSALNCKKLVVWIRLIVRTQGILENYYQPWSYPAKTGFEDALRSLDRLTPINFDLPVDLAIRQFQNIKDAFQ